MSCIYVYLQCIISSCHAGRQGSKIMSLYIPKCHRLSGKVLSSSHAHAIQVGPSELQCSEVRILESCVQLIQDKQANKTWIHNEHFSHVHKMCCSFVCLTVYKAIGPLSLNMQHQLRAETSKPANLPLRFRAA